mmetsp:Transcript_5473/g.11297  ORF Transcript_5473/g.11297 Transcript_5473/m.11297 type:complete len:292 (-) Transcript_5473:3108-3983(-)
MLLFSLFFTFSRKYILKDDRATARGPTLVNVTRNGPYELYVNGQLRTTTRTLRNTNYHNLKAGQYLLYINDSSYDEGGNPSIRRDTRKGIGILPSGWIYFYGENDNHDIRDGNMPIKIPSKYFKQNDPAQPFMIIKLPHQNQFRKLRFTMSGGSVLVYPQKIQQKICNTIPLEGLSKPNTLIGIFPNGEQVMYDPRVQILDNTPSKILQDGGGDEMSVGKLCSTAPRTFVNEDTCRMSVSPLACGSTAQITKKKNQAYRRRHTRSLRTHQTIRLHHRRHAIRELRHSDTSV